MPVADQANGAARQALGFSSSTAWAEIVGGPNQRITSESVIPRAIAPMSRSSTGRSQTTPSLGGGSGGSMPSVWNRNRLDQCGSFGEKPDRLLPLARAVLRLGLLRLLGGLRLLVHRDPPGMPVGR